jgi:beta-glucanase (GH16 family)
MDEANYPDGNNPLKTPCYLIMNTAIGGWAEAPNAADYPAQFEIDYVRYYTKGEKATPAQEEAEPAENKPAPSKKKKKKKKNSSRK